MGVNIMKENAKYNLLAVSSGIHVDYAMMKNMSHLVKGVK